MKFRLLEFLRCPVCRSVLRLEGPVIHRADRAAELEVSHCRGLCPFPEIVGHPRDCSDCVSYELIAGFLLCLGCGQRYTIDEGVPQFCHPDLNAATPAKARTASHYGYLWGRSTVTPEANELTSYHFNRMERALSLPPSNGLILDAGCGDGIDLANQAGTQGAEIIGVELSEGGCRASFQRSLAFSTAHVIQADLCRLPFDDDSFDFVYSYGVLHHLPSPKEGLQELVRVLKPGARVAAYLYKDFSDRAVGWRWLLTATNQLRRITPYLSHRVLYLLCQAASPLVYVLFTIPFRILRLIPGLRSLAADFPFRHATGPFSLVGDLYDRFAAPIERRYHREDAEALFQDGGLETVITTKDRGWMIAGTKPLSKRSCAG